MYNSSYRIKKQWNVIKDNIKGKDNIVPFRYGKNIRIIIDGEEIPVYSKRDYEKKQKYIFEKYGIDASPSLVFNLDMTSIFHDVERATGKLLGTKVEK